MDNREWLEWEEFLVNLLWPLNKRNRGAWFKASVTIFDQHFQDPRLFIFSKIFPGTPLMAPRLRGRNSKTNLIKARKFLRACLFASINTYATHSQMGFNKDFKKVRGKRYKVEDATLTFRGLKLQGWWMVFISLFFPWFIFHPKVDYLMSFLKILVSSILMNSLKNKYHNSYIFNYQKQTYLKKR